MCRVCNGNFPTKQEYDALRNQAKVLLDNWSKRGDAATNPAFVSEVVALDSLRLSSGAVWGNPDYQGRPIELIFKNSNFDGGLLLYVLFVWMDIQQKNREVVGSEWLAEANKWISGIRNNPPREDYDNVGPHLWKTRETASKSGSLSIWFARSITEIASNHRNETGNIYRMGGYIFRDLLAASQQRKRNTQGQNQLLGGRPALLDWKRLWVLLRSLRRDNSVVRCLFERALSGVSNGQKAIWYWYDDDYFDPRECQLPVDTRVKENWIKLMEGSVLTREQLELLADAVKPRVVAQQAKKLADQHSISPSVFDVLFLA